MMKTGCGFAAFNKTQRPGRFLIAAAMAAFILCRAPASAAQEKIADSEITAAVEREMIEDRGVNFHTIDVRVDQGIVSLSGAANNILAKQRAEELALKLKGVRAVVNTITVKPQGRSDAQIAGDAKLALLRDPAADSYEVKVESKDGKMTMRGEVQSFAESQLAELVVSGVKGVREVDNLISVRYKIDRPDAEIIADVRGRLAWDALIDDSLIVANVDGGKVTLTGTVGSAWERWRAMNDAQVAGTKSVVVEGLKVEALARDKMRKNGRSQPKTDAEIAKAVKAAFLHDPRVYSFNPNIEVKGGVVTLTGVVENKKASLAAEQDAKSTVGVWRVRNYLKVRPAAPIDDLLLADNIRRALLLDPFVDRYQVGVAVEKGEVSLSGTVDSPSEWKRAESVATGVNGVVEVRNNLAIQRTLSAYWTGPDNDVRIAQNIRDALSWSPFVDASHVKVIVQDGVVTLSGIVDTWIERMAAEENAFKGGALQVRNQLKVNGGPDFLF